MNFMEAQRARKIKKSRACEIRSDRGKSPLWSTTKVDRGTKSTVVSDLIGELVWTNKILVCVEF